MLDMCRARLQLILDGEWTRLESMIGRYPKGPANTNVFSNRLVPQPEGAPCKFVLECCTDEVRMFAELEDRDDMICPQ